MYVRPTEPRPLRGVFDDALRIYRGAGPATWTLAVALQLAVAVPSLFWQERLTPVLSGDLLDVPAALAAALSSPALWLVSLIAVPIYLILYSALIANINGVATARAVSAGAAVGLGVRLLPRAFLLGALVLGIVIVGLLLLLAPGVYWAGTLLLAFTVLVVEEADVSQSMAVSRRLIKGHWWRAATLISYVIVIDLLAYLAVTLISGAAALIFGAGGSAVLGVSQLLSLTTDILLAPLYAAAYVALYYDLTLREAAERSMAKAA